MSDDENLLHGMLDRWEEARDGGSPCEPSELCRDRPDLLPELARRIGDLLRVMQLESPQDEPAAPHELLAGRYLIKARLGHGKEGDVWLAHDTLIQRDVAVKMPRGDSDDLLAEARLVASLKHPNILKVLDAGHDRHGIAFVVSELMTGRTLAERLHSGDHPSVPVAAAIRWIGQIASALHAVHLAGRAHRDVKPSNILLDERDNAVLADFGIAIVVASQQPGGSTGSLAYKSPEQFAGEKLDARSDVYSLGLVAHELLAGCLPFTNLDDTAAIEREIVSGVDMMVSRKVHPRLRPVVARALSRFPDMRQESAPQFARELKQALKSSHIGRWLAVASLAAVVTLGLVGWRLRAEVQRFDGAPARPIEDAKRALQEGLGIQRDAMRKVNEMRKLTDGIVEEAMKDPVHRSRRTKIEAR